MRHDGFTLIELLVALAIAGIVISAITVFSSGPTAAEESSFVDNALAAVQTLPGLARQRRETLTMVVQNHRLITAGASGMVADGPTLQLPGDATVNSTLQVAPDTVTGALTVRVSNSCTVITPLAYGSTEKTPC